MKSFLKTLMFRLFRPALRDVAARLDGIQASCDAIAPAVHSQGKAIESLWAQKQEMNSLLAGAAAAIPSINARLARIERRLVSSAVWKGGLKGFAVDFSGTAVPEMTAKYHAELAFWESIVRRDAVTTWGMPFEEIYGSWQRIRMTELSEFLSLPSAEDPMDALAAWAVGRTAVEIGSGPFPSISLVKWKQAVAVDPLAEGYAAEDLIPKSVHADRVTFLASTGESIPLGSGTADLVVLENCLDHVEDPALVMRECKRVLREGGHLWLLVDLMDYRDHMHPNPFSEASIRALLASEGFTTLRDRRSDHKSHPQAYGEFRALATPSRRDGAEGAATRTAELPQVSVARGGRQATSAASASGDVS